MHSTKAAQTHKLGSWGDGARMRSKPTSGSNFISTSCVLLPVFFGVFWWSRPMQSSGLFISAD